MRFNESSQAPVQKQAPQAPQAPELPIDVERENLLEHFRNNESVIVIGETGSGKTTRIPIFLLEEFSDKQIFITSPRVLPARSVSRYVASKRGQVVGKEVGLITREMREVSEETKATFMTDGVLLSMLRKDPLLSECDIVMVDEAHERTVNIDLTLGFLKQAQVLRKEAKKSELKIIVTSATIEEEKFAQYFEKAPVAKVKGRMYPVELRYHMLMDEDREGFKSVINGAVEVTRRIIDEESEGDILIFMPGEEEIKKINPRF